MLDSGDDGIDGGGRYHRGIHVDAAGVVECAAAGADGDVGEPDVPWRVVADAPQQVGHASPAGDDAVHVVFLDPFRDLLSTHAIERLDEAGFKSSMRRVLHRKTGAASRELEESPAFQMMSGGHSDAPIAASSE